jgi:hypothetical protein
LVAVVALLAAAMFAAVYANPRIEYLPADPLPTRPFQSAPPVLTPSPEPLIPTPPIGLVDSWSLPGWLTGLLSGLCVAGFVTMIVLLLWLVLRDRLMERRVRFEMEAEPPPLPSLAHGVRAAVDEGLAGLDDSDGDPRRAVIACWVRLERAAAAAGIEREAGDTATDLVSRLLRTQSVSGEVLDGLATVYREARYATHTVDAAMREQARAALRQLRDELSAGVR